MGQRTTPVRRAGNGRSARDLLQQSRSVFEDLGSLGGAAGDVARGWQVLLRSRLERQPYATLAVAAGVGYVLGGGVPTAAVRILVGLGGRLAFERVLVHFATDRSP